MKLVGRIIFHLLAAASLTLLALVVWLCLGDGSVVTAGRFAAGREAGDVFFLMSVVPQANPDWERAWHAGGVSTGRVRSPHNDVVGLAYLKMPRGLALGVAALLPAAWGVRWVIKRRRAARREPDEEPQPPPPASSNRPNL